MDGIAWAASAMAAAQRRLEIAAQNLANASTDGFHRSFAHGFLSSDGVRIAPVREDEPGALRPTGRPYDLAISGRGTFRVSSADGRIAQTRAGSFTRDRFGHLIDDRGRMLLGEHGPVRIAPGAAVQIPLPPGSVLRSGFVESSNVDSISEVVDVISAERAFETAQKVLSAIDRTREHAGTQVAQIK